MNAYRRDATTWAAFGALFAFGFLNALLGPALPYLRAVEDIPYLVGALHQVAFAVGGGLAGLIAVRDRRSASRVTVIVGGLAGAALAGIAVGDRPAVTIAGAFALSLLATSALIRVWAVLADVHGSRRAVAMTEGEVSVSLAGIFCPLLIGALAATAVSWRFAFVAGALVTWAVWVWRVRMPAPVQTPIETAIAAGGEDRSRAGAALVTIFAIVALEFALSFWLASYLADDLGIARDAAAAAVSGLYAANLVGRLLTSRLARRVPARALLATAFAIALAALPVLLPATTFPVAAAGIAFTGAGIGAMFPLASTLHVEASAHGADKALGQVLSVAALGQVAGPLTAGAIAQASQLRTGLLVLPLLVVLAATGLRVASR